MHITMRTLVITGIALVTFSVQANHMHKDTIDKRTSPVGQVHIEGEVVESETAEAAPANAEPRTGDAIYGIYCVACHSTGLANAPKTHDTVIWATLMERGMDDLLTSAITGKNVMPPKGNCADCSDDELKSAIQFMSEAKQ